MMLLLNRCLYHLPEGCNIWIEILMLHAFSVKYWENSGDEILMMLLLNSYNLYHLPEGCIIWIDILQEHMRTVELFVL